MRRLANEGEQMAKCVFMFSDDLDPITQLTFIWNQLNLLHRVDAVGAAFPLQGDERTADPIPD